MFCGGRHLERFLVPNLTGPGIFYRVHSKLISLPVLKDSYHSYSNNFDFDFAMAHLARHF